MIIDIGGVTVAAHKSLYVLHANGEEWKKEVALNWYVMQRYLFFHCSPSSLWQQFSWLVGCTLITDQHDCVCIFRKRRNETIPVSHLKIVQ